MKCWKIHFIMQCINRIMRASYIFIFKLNFLWFFYEFLSCVVVSTNAYITKLPTQSVGNCLIAFRVNERNCLFIKAALCVSLYLHDYFLSVFKYRRIFVHWLEYRFRSWDSLLLMVRNCNTRMKYTSFLFILLWEW